MKRKESARKFVNLSIVKDLSSEELEELYTFLNKEEYEKDLMAMLYTKWIELSTSGDIKTEKIFNNVLYKAGIDMEKYHSDELVLNECNKSANSPKKRFLFFVRYAAILIFVVLATKLIFEKKGGDFIIPEQNTNNIATPYGSKTYLELSDGTRIWLNSGSKLNYPSKFINESRNIDFEGEAFFEVAHVKDKPFIVHTSGINIMVLGTSFNLKSYPDEKNIETTLIEGSVKLIIPSTSKSKSDEIILKPSEKATYNKVNSSLIIDNLSYTKEIKKPASGPENKEVIMQKEFITAWKNEQLIFQRESIYDIAKKLERWYGMKLVIDSEISDTGTYSGKFLNNETIYQVLEAISTITPLHTELKGNTIYIKPGER